MMYINSLKINPRNIIALLTAAAICFLPAAAQTPATKLEFGKTIEQTIKGGETQTFQFKLKKGEFARAEVVPTNIDIVVLLIAPDGRIVVEMDGDFNYLWRESVSVIANTNGIYKLQIMGKGTTEIYSNYAIKLAELRESAALDYKRIGAEQNLVQAIKISQDNKAKESIPIFEKSVSLWREVGDKYWEAVTNWNFAMVLYFSDRDDAALKLFNEVMPVFQKFEDRIGESATFNGIGNIYLFAKKYDLAKANLEKALAARNKLKNFRSEYKTLRALITVYINLKSPDKVLESLNRMLQISEDTGDHKLESETLTGFGLYYSDSKDFPKAQFYLEKSLNISKEFRDYEEEYNTLENLDDVYKSLKLQDKVLDGLKRRLIISDELNAAAKKLNTLKKLGDFFQENKNFAQALDSYEAALRLFDQFESKSTNKLFEFYLLKSLIPVYKQSEKFEKRLRTLDRLLAITKEEKNEKLEADVLIEFGNYYFDIPNANNEKEIEIKNTQEAIVFFKKAYAIYVKLPVDDDTRKGKILSSFYTGLSYSNIKETESSALNFLITLNLLSEWEKSCSDCDLKVITTISYTELAKAYFLDGNEEEALRYLKKIDYENLEYWKGNQEILKNSLDLLDSILVSLGDVNEYESTIGIYDFIVKNYKFYGFQDDDLMGFYLSLGKAYTEAGYYDLAKSNCDKALQLNLYLQEKTKNSGEAADKAIKKYLLTDEATLRNNIGIIFLRTGDFEQAQKYIQTALNLVQSLQDPDQIIKWKSNLAAVYARQKKYDPAISIFDEVIPQLKKLRNENAANFISERVVSYRLEENELSQFVGIDLYYYGTILRAEGKIKEAINYHKESIQTLNQYKSRKFEGRARIELGLDYLAQSQPNLALNEFRTAYSLSKEANARDEQAVSLDCLMRVWKELNKEDLAIIFGKQSINLLQKTRAELEKIGKNTASEFVKDNENTYRKLADILISQGRFPEAQAVLNLLKEEEYSPLTRTGEKSDTVPYSKTEESVIAKTDRLFELEKELSELKKQQKEQGSQFPAEKAESLKQIDAEITVANGEFENALKVLSESVTDSNLQKQIAEIISERNLQSALSDLKTKSSGVVALYTLIGTEEVKDETGKDKNQSKFGWVILVTENDRKAYPIDVSNLEELVYQFRAALSSPTYNPQPLAQKLYNAIFRQTSARQRTTLEADLQKVLGKYQDKTLMWSLDGVLRYIPMAALHDGSGYLVEKYRNVLFTKESFLWLTKQPKSNPLTLGLGVSAGNKELRMTELPGVEKELTDIIKQPNEENGILRGRRKLNSQFTRQDILNLKDEDNEFQIVHIASHYSFNPTDQDSSYLLVGDGKMTFADIKRENNLFRTVDQLTLSACDTGSGGNGKEAEGFAYLAQSLGAKSVIASLWQVSDAGTPELMIRFYKLRAEHPEMSKGEAFREAQLSLLDGDKIQTRTETDKTNRAEIVGGNANELKLPLFIKDAQKPFAHPHYWSSFVLIGNWR